MSPLLTVILVCASTVAPSDCNRDTALDQVIAPADGPVACLMGGQFTVAGGALAGALAEGRYLKIGCERRKATF